MAATDTAAMTVLAPMTADEYQAYAAEAVPAYALEKVAAGQWSESEAPALARKSFDELLPQGLATPDHHLFTLRESPSGVAVGMLWIAQQQHGAKRIAYVYDVSIRPEHRRKGHAGRAFRALEDEVRARGLAGIALHVFGHNHAAQALYARLGYRPTNINLFKDIAAAQA